MTALVMIPFCNWPDGTLLLSEVGVKAIRGDLR